jgi:opacity protein-like surface antigen
MKHRLLSIAALLTLSSISSLALADADHGAYGSIEGGYGWVIGPDAKMNGSTGTAKVGAPVWGGNLGYYFPLDAKAAWLLEAGYSDNGYQKYTGGGGVNDTGTLKLDSTNYDVLIGFNTVFDNGFNIAVKGGAAYVKQTANLNGPVNLNGTTMTAFNDKGNCLNPMIVLDTGYKLTSALNSYLSFSYISGQFNTSWSDYQPTAQSINKSRAVFAVKAGLSYAFME